MKGVTYDPRPFRQPRAPSNVPDPSAPSPSHSPGLSAKAQRLASSYLQRILTAKVYDVARETPLEAAKSLSRRVGNTVLLKREDQQPVFSFKLRGAWDARPWW